MYSTYDPAPEADLAATKAGCLSNAQQAANKRNQDCIQVFTTCFQNNTKLMTEVQESKTTDWPDGCTWVVVQFNNDKFKAVDNDAKEQKMNKLNKITMEVTKDPENLFNKIRTVNAIYLTTTLRMTNEEKVLHAIAKLPKQIYETTVKQIKSEWEIDCIKKGVTEELPFNYLVCKINKYYKAMSNAKDGEVSFFSLYKAQQAAKNSSGKGNGGGDGNSNGGGIGNDIDHCYNCRNDGHKTNKCRLLSKGCNHCGATNHVKSNCYIKFPHKRKEDQERKRKAKAKRKWKPRWKNKKRRNVGGNGGSGGDNNNSNNREYSEIFLATVKEAFEFEEYFSAKEEHVEYDANTDDDANDETFFDGLNDNFLGNFNQNEMALLVQENNDDDVESDEESMPKLITRHKEDSSNEESSDDNSMSGLQERIFEDSSDDDSSNDESMPGLVNRIPRRSFDVRNAFINIPYLVDDYDDSSDEEDFDDGNNDEESKPGSENNNETKDDDIIELFTSEMKKSYNNYNEEEKYYQATLKKMYTEYILSNLMCFPNVKEILLLDTMGIGDTKSSTHSSGSLCGADNMKDNSDGCTSTDASGKDIDIAKIFDLHVDLKDKFGNSKGRVQFERMRYHKGKPFTLISITAIMKKGFKLFCNNEQGIILQKGDIKICFDIPVRTKEGVIWCINFQRLNPNNYNSKAAFAKITMNVQKAHSLLGHMDEARTRKVCAHLNWKLTCGTLGPCKLCAI